MKSGSDLWGLSKSGWGLGPQVQDVVLSSGLKLAVQTTPWNET